MYPIELGTPKSEHFLHEEVPLALELFQGGVLFGTPRVFNWRGSTLSLVFGKWQSHSEGGL